jgi:drug/metabolite transporter (DMT)-like permease
MFGEFLSISLPEIILMLSVISSAASWIALNELLKRGYHVSVLNGLSMLGAGSLGLLGAVFFERALLYKPMMHLYTFSMLTIMIIFICNIFFTNMYGILLKKYSPTFLSFAGFMCPLFTALFGIVFLHEQVTWHFMLSSLTVFLGLYLFSY